MTFDLDAVRAQFPILKRRIDGATGVHPLVFMDHGASTHACQPVLDAVRDLHEGHYANIHRGNHHLSLEASDLFDAASDTFARFIGAEGIGEGSDSPGVFVMGGNTTDSLTLAAHVMADQPGKTLTTLAEHHSNDLPHRERGDVVHTSVDGAGRPLLDEMEDRLQRGDIKLVAVSGCSNVTGYFPPINKMARMAHDAGARILVDAAQLYAHAPIDVRPDDHPEHIDFLAAAGHKAYAPFGSSFLYGPRDLMDAAPPYMPGGGTVHIVSPERAWFNRSPDRHMGGTPNITGVIAFAAATRWLQALGMDAVREHELELLREAMLRFEELADLGVRLLGPSDPREKAGVLSFMVPGIDHATVSRVLSGDFGIATRNGCFCAQPLLAKLLGLGDVAPFGEAMTRGEHVDLPGATRATIGVYQTAEEVEVLCEAVDVVAHHAWLGDYEEPGPEQLVEVS